MTSPAPPISELDVARILATGGLTMGAVMMTSFGLVVRDVGLITMASARRDHDLRRGRSAQRRAFAQPHGQALRRKPRGPRHIRDVGGRPRGCDRGAGGGACSMARFSRL